MCNVFLNLFYIKTASPGTAFAASTFLHGVTCKMALLFLGFFDLILFNTVFLDI